MSTYFCLDCGKESKKRDLKKKLIEEFDDAGLICAFFEYCYSCGANKFAVVKYYL